MAIPKEEVLKLISDLVKSTISTFKLLLLDPSTTDYYYYADDDSLLNFPVPVSAVSGPLFVMDMDMDMDRIKNRLPLLTFGDFQCQSKRLSPSEEEEEEEMCAICLSGVETGHEMRQLPNCCHVFHSDCLDKWMDQRQITCPTCRSDLIILPGSSNPFSP